MFKLIIAQNGALWRGAAESSDIDDQCHCHRAALSNTSNHQSCLVFMSLFLSFLSAFLSLILARQSPLKVLNCLLYMMTSVVISWYES